MGFGALAWTLLPSEPRNGAIWTYAVASFSGGAFLVFPRGVDDLAPDDVLDTFIDVLPAPADLPLPAAVGGAGIVSLWLPSVFLVLTLGLLLFPDGRPPSPKWRWVVQGEIAVVVVATVGNIVLFHPWTTAPINTYDTTFGTVVELLTIVVVVAALVGRVARRPVPTGVRRSYGARSDGSPSGARLHDRPGGSVRDLGRCRGGPEQRAGSFGSVTSLLGLIPLMLLILSFWVAITKYRLYDLDRVISKSVTYLGLGAVITALFALVVAVPTLVLGRSDDGQPNVCSRSSPRPWWRCCSSRSEHGCSDGRIGLSTATGRHPTRCSRR